MARGIGYQKSAQAEKITQLRKSGDLRGAYSEARSQFAKGNREDSFMQSYSWVLHDCLKRYMSAGTKFYKDVPAFCSTLAQIRAFPVDTDRDDLFLDQVKTKVKTVGWGLRKDGDVRGLVTLSAEICKWGRHSFLFDTEIARMLLVGLKEHGALVEPVLHWLGFDISVWDQAYNPAFIESLASRKRGDVAVDVAMDGLVWAYYDDLKKSAGDDRGQRLDVNVFLRTIHVLGVVNNVIDQRHEALDYAKKKLLHVGWRFRGAKDKAALERLLAEVVVWPAGTAFHATDVLTMFYVSLKDSPESLIRLVEWFGFDCLTSVDYKDRQVNGNSYPSTAQDLARTYLDALLSFDPDGSPVATFGQREHGCATIEKLLNNSICAEWIWESYKLGKLQVEQGYLAKARKRFALLVASKPKEAWSWAAYGRTWQQDDYLKYEACVLKGLSVSRDMQTSLSVHEDAARIFISKNMFPEAKTEVIAIADFRRASGWKVSEFTDEARRQDWYKNADSRQSNQETYREMSNDADEIVAADLPWTEFYVEWRSKDKGLVGLVTKEEANDSYARNTIKDVRVKFSRKNSRIIC